MKTMVRMKCQGSVCVCVCVCVCVGARACVCACVRAYVSECIGFYMLFLFALFVGYFRGLYS